MMMYVYVRRDNDTPFYPPLVAPCDVAAFSTYVSVYGGFTATSSLYRIGLFNSETGAIEGTDVVDLSSAFRSWMDDYSKLAFEFQKRVSEIGGSSDGEESN